MPSQLVPHHAGSPWRVSGDLELRPQRGVGIDSMSMTTVIDPAAFSARHRVCLVCVSEADTVTPTEDETVVPEEWNRTENGPPEPAGVYVQAEFAPAL